MALTVSKLTVVIGSMSEFGLPTIKIPHRIHVGSAIKAMVHAGLVMFEIVLYYIT